MTLKEQINVDVIAAMKAKDAMKLETLRMLQSAIKNVEIEKRGKGSVDPITDDDVRTVIGRQVKQRVDAATQYRAGGREELAVKEDAERVLLEAYLPAQMSDDELRVIVLDGIKSVGANGPGDLGKVMGVLTPKTRGRAAGARVSALVKQLLVAKA